MEVVYTNRLSDKFIKNSIHGIYGDVLNLKSLNVKYEGINYDDTWSVKRFLNGRHLFFNKRINDILNYLEIEVDILNKKIYEISRTDFKFVLLAYLLINNKKIIIFDYLEYGLSYKDLKRLINITRKLNKDGIKIIIVSKNIEFMSKLVDNIFIFKKDKLAYEGSMNDAINSNNFSNSNILKFIDLANKNDANLEYTLDSKELLKDIYRSVDDAILNKH